MIEDYISGEKFKSFCDIRLDDKDLSILDDTNKSTYILYADSEKYVDALSFIHHQSPNKFVLVTHNGDTEIKSTGLPHNLVYWFAQNLNFKHPQVSPLPIGLENTHWHPNKIPMMMKAKPFFNRKIKVFGQFNTETYPKERCALVRLMSDNIMSDWYPARNGVAFDHYLNNLLNYQYCFCPRGNGIDTHRIWECLYMGCIPVVKAHITHMFPDSDLPIYFVKEWDDFYNWFLWNKGNFDSPMLTMTYWKNKIQEHIK